MQHTKVDGLEGVTMVGTLRKERSGREAKGMAGPTGGRSRVERVVKLSDEAGRREGTNGDSSHLIWLGVFGWGWDGIGLDEGQSGPG